MVDARAAGAIERIQPETDDASTVVVRPSFEWPGHRPGQYLRIGVEIDGVRHWRAYSLTSDPDHPEGLISITVKHVEEGKLSPYFTRQVEPGTTVYLGGVEGTFGLPDPLPEKLSLPQRRQRHHPDLEHDPEPRRATRRSTTPSTCTAAASADDFIFGETLRELPKQQDGYRLDEHLERRRSRLIPPPTSTSLCPDWREREAFLSGPREMLDAMLEHWERARATPSGSASSASSR